MGTINFSTRKIDLTIVLISLLVMAVVVNLPFRAKPLGDVVFHEETKNVALYIKGVLPAEKVVITRAPGPILFYLPAYFIAPSDATDSDLWLYATIFSFGIATVSLMLTFRIACLFFSKEVGVLTMMLFFIFPIHFYYSLGILAEVPAFFSVALGIYGWTVAFRDPNKKSGWIFLATGICFLILNRPNAILLLVLGFGVVAYSFVVNKTFFKAYGKKLCYTLLCVTCIGYSVREGIKAINGEKIKTDQEELFYCVAHVGRFQFREEPLDFRFWTKKLRGEDSKDYQNWTKSLNDVWYEQHRTHQLYKTIYKNFLIDDIKQHPFLFTRQFLIRCVYGNIHIISSVRPNKFNLGPFKGNAGYILFNILINLVNLIIVAGALLFLIKEKHLITYWIFWGVILALLIFHAIFYMEPRYIFPSKIAMYLMGAAGLYRITWIKHKVDWLSGFLFPRETHVI